MRRLLALLAVASIALVGAGASSAAPVLIAHEPFSGTEFSLCTGEAISFEGNLTVILQDFIDESGQHHLLRVVKVQAKGTGLTTGTTYTVQSTFTETLNISTPPGAEIIFTSADSSILNSHGSATNQILHTFAEGITVNGELKIFRFDFSLECT
jgi:hypothetical protein